MEVLRHKLKQDHWHTVLYRFNEVDFRYSVKKFNSLHILSAKYSLNFPDQKFNTIPNSQHRKLATQVIQ